MRLNTHLTFNGQCREAFEYYEKHLGGEITLMMTYGDSPIAAEMSADLRDKVLHATFVLGEELLTGCDAPPESYLKPRGFSVLLSVDDATEADRIFTALAEDGTVQMPLEETFWAQRFGMVVDQFGTPWMLNCGRSETDQNPR